MESFYSEHKKNIENQSSLTNKYCHLNHIELIDNKHDNNKSTRWQQPFNMLRIVVALRLVNFFKIYFQAFTLNCCSYSCKQSACALEQRIGSPA